MARDRILVWGLSDNRAGTEMVIYHYAKKLPGASFDFLCYEEPASFSDLFDSGRNRWFTIPVKLRHPIAHGRALRAFMTEHACEYRALWMNVNDISNIDLLGQAARRGIPKRVLHMHSSSIPHRFVTRFFSALNGNAARRFATDRWACSTDAGRFLYGDVPYEVVPNRVDAATCRFSGEARRSVRERWGLEGAFVVGAVGRLSPEKNHRLLIDALPGLLAEQPDARLLIVGAGPLEGELRQRAEASGVASAVVWAGRQERVGDYLSAMDVFAMPSFFEGLSLSLLEAQFNGLPCVVSEGVTSEGIIASGVASAPVDDRCQWQRLLLEASRDRAILDEGRAARFDANQDPGRMAEVLLGDRPTAGKGA